MLDQVEIFPDNFFKFKLLPGSESQIFQYFTFLIRGILYHASYELFIDPYKYLKVRLNERAFRFSLLFTNMRTRERDPLYQISPRM